MPNTAVWITIGSWEITYYLKHINTVEINRKSLWWLRFQNDQFPESRSSISSIRPTLVKGIRSYSLFLRCQSEIVWSVLIDQAWNRAISMQVLSPDTNQRERASACSRCGCYHRLHHVRFLPAKWVRANESWLHFHTHRHARQLYACTDTRRSRQSHTPRDVNTHQIALLSIFVTDLHTHINPLKEGWKRQFAKDKWRKLFYSAGEKGSISFHLIFNPNIEMGGTLSPYLFIAIRSATLNAYRSLIKTGYFYDTAFFILPLPFESSRILSLCKTFAILKGLIFKRFVFFTHLFQMQNRWLEINDTGPEDNVASLRLRFIPKNKEAIKETMN